MRIFPIFSLLFILCTAISYVTANPTRVKTPKKIKFYQPEEEYGFKEIISHVEEAKSGDTVFSAQFVLTNQEYVNALKKAAENGADVQLVVDDNNPKSIENAKKLIAT